MKSRIRERSLKYAGLIVLIPLSSTAERKLSRHLEYGVEIQV
jgi:hypothetical protein